MYGCIEDGLENPRRGSKKSKPELPVWVVGTCIQLLLDASGTDEQPKDVAKKLKAHKKAETVKDPRAIELLEVHIFYFYFFMLKGNITNLVYSSQSGMPKLASCRKTNATMSGPYFSRQ